MGSMSAMGSVVIYSNKMPLFMPLLFLMISDSYVSIKPVVEWFNAVVFAVILLRSVRPLNLANILVFGSLVFCRIEY